ncbi:PH domain-containing protein [Streptomyces sp. NPDC059009]|uniref:PH domain-containing protein n=1 Tax=Streptomyces sp. NPDC059009 TaxID=3346694 RepID=UPI0036AD1427
MRGAVEGGTGNVMAHDSGWGAWRRLDKRLLLVQLKWLVPPVFSVGFYGVVGQGRLDREAFVRLGLIGGVFLAIMLWRLVELLTTSYRVTDELLEVRTGLLGRRHRAVPCDRIRGVDLVADPFLRVFGLVAVKVTTAEGGGGGGDGQGDVRLEALRKGDAGALRQQLLRRSVAAATARRSVSTGHDRVIARLDWAWLRYMPLNSWGVLAVVVAGGAGVRVLDGLGVEPERVLRATVGVLGVTGLWEGVALGALALLVLGSVTAVALAAEEWWGYRLERDENGDFAVRRGLLTTRSLSVDARRMRGVEVTEPLVLRLGGGAQVAAVATGLDTAEESEATKLRVLSPAVPRRRAHQIAAAVAGSRLSPTAVRLRRHPRAALRRRHVRAAVMVLAGCAVPAVIGLCLALVSTGTSTSAAASAAVVLLHSAWISAVVLLPLGALCARGAYRSLGHALEGPYLVTRYGFFVRRTVALRRDSVIGWKIAQSPLQRRAGLATLYVTTAACKSGAFPVRDVELAEGLRFAAEAVPGLLAPFVERR